MRKLIYPAVAVFALLAAGYAVANGVNAQDAKSVAGSFAATAASTSTRTCTTADNKTIAVTTGRYTGTAIGDPDLAGAITLRARSVVDQTDGVGTVTGSLRIDVSSGRDTLAAFSAVYDHGKIAGLAAGRAHDPGARLLANLSAGFDAASGFTDGKLGGTSGGGAVEIVAGRCKTTKPVAEHSTARGTVSAVSGDSITVAGLTCDVPSDLASKVATFKTGDRAEIRCTLTSGKNTLTHIQGKH